MIFRINKKKFADRSERRGALGLYLFRDDWVTSFEDRGWVLHSIAPSLEIMFLRPSTQFAIPEG